MQLAGDQELRNKDIHGSLFSVLKKVIGDSIKRYVECVYDTLTKILKKQFYECIAFKLVINLSHSSPSKTI